MPNHPPRETLRLCLTLLAWIGAGVGWCWGQASSSQGEDLRVSILTIGPGEMVYEKFGHNAIVFEDRSGRWLRQSVAFNYGVFAFGPDFLPKFIDGNMRYWTEAQRFDALLNGYSKDNRSMWMQELNLTPAQRLHLLEYLFRHSDPKDPSLSFYTYNYYNSNCSTKVRDAIDQEVGGELRAQLGASFTGHTYRWHTRRIARYQIPLYTSLEFILGHAVDQPLTEWEEAFLPLEFQKHLRHVTVLHDGRPVPLVVREWTLFEGTRPPLAETPPHWGVGYLIAGILLGVAFVLLAGSTSPWARSAFSGLAMAWSLLVGGAGVFLSYAFTTGHWSTYWNENILQFFPIALALVVLIPVAVLGKRAVAWKMAALLGVVAVAAIIALLIPLISPAVRAVGVPLGVGWGVLALSLALPESPARRACLGLAAAVALAGLVGLACKALPGFYQMNWDMIALALPSHLGLAVGMWRILGVKADIIPAQAPLTA